MIENFACADTEKVFKAIGSRRLPADIQRVVRRKLIYLDEAEDLRDLMSPPANRLKALKGSRSGQYSIRINDQWRVCFKWSKGNAKDVEIVDYH